MEEYDIDLKVNEREYVNIQEVRYSDGKDSIGWHNCLFGIGMFVVIVVFTIFATASVMEDSHTVYYDDAGEEVEVDKYKKEGELPQYFMGIVATGLILGLVVCLVPIIHGAIDSHRHRRSFYKFSPDEDDIQINYIPVD